MKRLILCTAVMAVAISCNNPSSNSTAKMDNNSQQEQNIANNKKIYAAVESGNTSGIDSLIASDAVDHDGPRGTEVSGKDSIVHMLSSMHNQFKDLKFDVISSAADGDYVFSLVHITGTPADSSIMGGMAMDQKGVDVVKFNNDHRITDHWGFTEDQEVSKIMKMQANTSKEGSKMKK